ncbi:MAG: WD40 repeat domain-containing protein [Nitrospira sp.]|nr:WD40 repeat domain-containing protein [Nitrospira sp.]
MIHSVAIHQSLPFAASIGTDHTVALWRVNEDAGELEPLTSTSVRDVACSNDSGYVEAIASHSVAIAFHESERRLVTRSGNGGVLEASFTDDGKLQLLSCVRYHRDWDVQMVRYVAGSDEILSAGRDGCVVMSHRGRELARWQLFGEKVCHWIEHIDGSEYLIASDSGAVGRIDITNQVAPIVGERFARDDMEFVTFNKTSGRAFATSFDRGVYEINPKDCQSMGLRFSPGYKSIWAKTLEREPKILLVHSRNGAIYKADLETGETISKLHRCPPTIWSVVVLPDNSLIGAGEGSVVFQAEPSTVDAVSRTLNYEIVQQATPLCAEAYTKRIALDVAKNRLFLGRTDGKLWIYKPESKGRKGRCIEVYDADSAIRDLAVTRDGSTLFLVTEDGRAVRLDTHKFEKRAEFQTRGKPFPLPLWALAYNPDRELVAVADREASLNFLRAEDLQPIGNLPTKRVKRIKWFSSDTVFYSDQDNVWSFDLAHEELVCRTGQGLQNTIEDFIWDASSRYLLAISYQCVIGLFDLATGQLLDQVRDRMDYPKGIAWLPAPDGGVYPWDFVTWGRSGDLHRYRLHEERILSIGPLANVRPTGV